MEVLLLFSAILVLVSSSKKQFELKVNYYEKLIKNAFEQKEEYRVRQDNSDYLKNVRNEGEIEDYGTFDFIVVGAGSSGSVVATRLSEIERFKVLLLEAGDWDDDLTSVPYLSNLLQFSNRNWGYFTEPQKNGGFGWKNYKLSYPRGKIVGGSSSINYLTYARGNKNDYDNWANMGNQGWSFNDVLPYFKKLENFQSDKIDLKYRGFAGPINVVQTIPERKFEIIKDTFDEIGVGTVDDFNARTQLGVSITQRTTECGRRDSAATAYVRPSNSRHNFNVTVKAFVTKILIDDSTKTAYGVEFVKNGCKYQVKASKEVILSAGTFNSAQLLMLSGVGPRDELSRFNIPVIADLPVGKQLKDHFEFQIAYRTNLTAKTKTFRRLLEEFLRGKGILTNYQNEIGISYFNTRNSSSSAPTLEISVSFPSPIRKSIPALSNFTDEVKNYLKKLNPQKDIYVHIFLEHPKSSGTLKLQSNNPEDFPLIDLDMFSHPDDLEVYYDGIKIVERISETKLSKKIDAQLIDFQFCNDYQKGSKEYWICALEYMAMTGYHASSTVKMGPRNDEFAAVDPELCVYGVEKLRVVDCSVMPDTITGHNNAVALMIGEKAADLIKRDHSVDNAHEDSK